MSRVLTNKVAAGCRVDDYEYELPENLIAQTPLARRSASRLLTVDGTNGGFADLSFSAIETLLRPGDLLVVNNTKVVPARIYGTKETGGRVEILLERVIDPFCAMVQIQASKPPRPGSRITLDSIEVSVQVVSRDEGFYRLTFPEDHQVLDVFTKAGHTPLPPYIHRQASPLDEQRYQTVYAKDLGAVAAPTAGLHFDVDLLERVKQNGVGFTQITLHVGAGTFQPLRVSDIRDHRMHSEFIQVGTETCDAIAETRRHGGRIVAVGTTVVRALETASLGNEVVPFSGETSIFIYPGYRFQAVDVLVTNFHLPRSTLLMLVCAFAGRDLVLRAYRHAVEQHYRFFSYGDAMWLTPKDTECGSR